MLAFLICAFTASLIQSEHVLIFLTVAFLATVVSLVLFVAAVQHIVYKKFRPYVGPSFIVEVSVKLLNIS